MTLDGAKMAEGGSMNEPAGSVEAGLDPDPAEDSPLLLPPAEGIWKLPAAAAAAAWDSMVPMASHMGLLNSLLPSEDDETSWSPNSPCDS